MEQEQKEAKKKNSSKTIHSSLIGQDLKIGNVYFLIWYLFQVRRSFIGDTIPANLYSVYANVKAIATERRQSHNGADYDFLRGKFCDDNTVLKFLVSESLRAMIVTHVPFPPEKCPRN